MDLLTYILTLALTGFIVGGLARLALPGREALGVFGTILAGLAGSFVGGLIVTYLIGSTNWLLTLAVAVGCAVLFILPFRVFVATPVVVPRTSARRGLFGARPVDADYPHDGYGRRPLWGRRRPLI